MIAVRADPRRRWPGSPDAGFAASGEISHIGVVKNAADCGRRAVADPAVGAARRRAHPRPGHAAAAGAGRGHRRRARRRARAQPGRDPPAPRRHARRRRRGRPASSSSRGAARPGPPGQGFTLTDAGRRPLRHPHATTTWPPPRCAGSPRTAAPTAVAAFAAEQVAGAGGPLPGGDGGGRRRPARPGRGARRRAHRRGLRCQRVDDRLRRAALPAPLPGGARGRRVPAAVRGRDRR